MFRKEKLTTNCFLTLEFDNLWFMDFKFIPKGDRSPLLTKYDNEIFKMVGQSNNAHKPLEKYMSKLLNNDLSIEKGQDICMKVKDSFQGKFFSFVVIINEISQNQLEFKLNIRKSVLDSDPSLINYLKTEVLGMIFPDGTLII